MRILFSSFDGHNGRFSVAHMKDDSKQITSHAPMIFSCEHANEFSGCVTCMSTKTHKHLKMDFLIVFDIEHTRSLHNQSKEFERKYLSNSKFSFICWQINSSE